MRNRSIQWMETKIVQVLSKSVIQSYLALSSLVLRDVRSFEEQHNLDIAIQNLLSRKIIQRYKQDSMTNYRLAG